MEDNNRLDRSELEFVTGGASSNIGQPRFQHGDRVKLLLYSEYGPGTVQSSYFDGDVWKCVVIFSAGTMEAPETEFELVV